MKHILFSNYWSILLCFWAMAACKKDDAATQASAVRPVPLFKVQNDNCEAPCEVVFSNLSSDADNFLWNFGDNGTSSDKDAKHTYNQGGTFTVSLKATKGSISLSTTQNVTILAPYSKVTIKKITLKSFPAAKADGTKWDGTTNPDVFIEVRSKADKKLLYRPDNILQYLNFDPAKLPIVYVLDPALLINGLDQDIDFAVYDSDTTEISELIGLVTFRFSDYKSAKTLPTSLEKKVGDTTISLELSWSR
jgi:PKD repeat protein